MEVEIHVDRTAYRHHRRGMLLFALATALFMPAVLLVLYSLAAVMGREAVRAYSGAACVGGFLAVLATFFYGVRQSLAYRCTRCGRRLPRVVPRDQSRPNIHFHCADCRIIWDLGWHWGENA
jgi:DNA-directed RNA polymerase subunit RPC12/RpoP